MDLELLKIWHNGMRGSQENKAVKKEGGASFKEKLAKRIERAAGTGWEEESGVLNLPDLHRRCGQELFWQKRQEQRRLKNKRLAKEEEALATQRIRMIKAINFARARYGK